jgi:hypothetical protein
MQSMGKQIGMTPLSDIKASGILMRLTNLEEN